MSVIVNNAKKLYKKYYNDKPMIKKFQTQKMQVKSTKEKQNQIKNFLLKPQHADDIYEVGSGFWLNSEQTSLFTNIAYTITNFTEATRFPNVESFLKHNLNKKTSEVIGKTRYKLPTVILYFIKKKKKKKKILIFKIGWLCIFKFIRNFKCRI